MIKNLQNIMNQFGEHGEEAVNGCLFDLIKKGVLTKELFLDYLGTMQGDVVKKRKTNGGEDLCEEAED